MTVGSIGAGAGAIFGSGAFTSVSAERTVNLTVEGDTSAKLALSPNNGSQLVETDSTDNPVIQFTDQNINDEAYTVYDKSLQITNNASEEVAVYIDESSPSAVGSELHFFRDDGSKTYIDGYSSYTNGADDLVGSGNGITLTSGSPGETATVDIVIDLNGSSAG